MIINTNRPYFMKKLVLLGIALFSVQALMAQKVGIKNNLIYDAFLTPNLGLEIGLGEKTTLDLEAGYNWFDLNKDKNKKLKHWLAQPELRFWSCERFNGFFWGIHAHGGEFNVANIKMPFGILHTLEDHRYEGHFYGGGASVGYQWIIGKRWNLEASIGAGYAHYKYDKYLGDDPCADCLKHASKNYWGGNQSDALLYLLLTLNREL